MGVNKNRLAKRNQAADPYVRLSRLIYQMFPTYPDTVEELISELEDSTLTYDLCELVKKLNGSMHPKQRRF